MKNKKILATFFILIIVSVITELFIFNFRHFTTLTYNQKIYDDFIVNDGFIKISDNEYQALDTGEKSIEILDINEIVKNLQIDFEYKNASDNKAKKLRTVIYATDEANELYYNLPSREIIHSVLKSTYFNLNLSGKSEKIKINFDVESGQLITINSISINSNIPFFISIPRMIFSFIFLLICILLKPSSKIYQYKFDLTQKKQKYVLSLIILAQILLFSILVGLNPSFTNPPWSHHKQYQELAVSLSKGYTYLDIEPSEAILGMDNPYDTHLRDQIMAETGDRYRWDSSYYNGKYYVYFGIVPELIFYYPYYLLTGKDFSTYKGIFITSIFFIIFSYGLLSQIIKKWFKNTPFAIYLILGIILTNCCGIFYIITRPDFYSLPIIMGLTFSIMGLYFWFSALQDDENNEIENKKLKVSFKLFIGSLCMALVAGCRPQLLLSSFFAIPLFADKIFKERKLFSKHSISESICFCLPYIVVAIGIMYYNYIRFGSVFDFGANYNLTTNDMTKRGFKLGRIPLGIFMYLFQPLTIVSYFPFVSSTTFNTNYLGTTIHEAMFGGVIVNNILLYSSIFINKVKIKLKEKRAFLFTVLCIIFAIIIVIADTEMAGILYRYVTDFSWLIYLFSILIVLSMYELLEENNSLKRYLYLFLLISLFSGLFYNVLIGFNTVNTPSIYETNSEFFYKFAYTVQFWL